MRKLIQIIVLTYLIQNALFYISTFLPKTSNNTFQKDEKLELWNCINLNLGANIGPSLLYKFEYWRVIFCFFLHENAQHLLLNIIIILYYSQTIKISFKQKFYQVFILASINANLTSILLEPNFLKIGSSFLSTVLITLSFLENFGNFKTQFFVDILMMVLIFLGVFNENIDNVVHLFGVGFSLVYWMFLRKKRDLNVLLFILIGYMALAVAFLQVQKGDLKEEIVVGMNYGCPNSFMGLLRFGN